VTCGKWTPIADDPCETGVCGWDRTEFSSVFVLWLLRAKPMKTSTGIAHSVLRALELVLISVAVIFLSSFLATDKKHQAMMVFGMWGAHFVIWPICSDFRPQWRYAVKWEPTWQQERSVIDALNRSPEISSRFRLDWKNIEWGGLLFFMVPELLIGFLSLLLVLGRQR